MANERRFLFDQYDYDDEEDNAIACKRCGADGLHWERARGEHNEIRWVLMEADDSIHVCPDAAAAKADEFPTEG
jgi:hypothetical protein